jgi:hypothetical protein
MADVRARYESWREARVRARLAWLTGESVELDFQRADEEHLDVTSGDALPELEKELARASFDSDRDRHARMIGAVKGAVVARRTRELAARARARPDAVGLREELVARESGVLGELGFANARAYAESLRPGVDFDFWSAQAELVLAATGSRFRDAERAVRPLAWDDVLPAARLRSTLDLALEGLRVPLERAPGLRIDGAQGARVPAFAAAPRLPGEVVLGLARRAGIPALEAAFAAASEALYSSFTSSALPLERRVLGDPATTAMWRLFLPQVLAEPSFADAGPVGGHGEAFGVVLRARRLAAVRCAAALVAPELALAELAPGSDPHGLEALYAERLDAALGRGADESAFLLECSARLGSVDELRGLALAVGLTGHLRERFGRRWWSTRAAGELVLELWNTGTTYAPEALARELGIGPLGADALVRALL